MNFAACTSKQSAGSAHGFHHRHRRFRIRPEALGIGYHKQEAPRILVKPQTEPPVPEQESESRSEPHRLARNGLRACLLVMMLILAIVYWHQISGIIYILTPPMKP